MGAPLHAQDVHFSVGDHAILRGVDLSVKPSEVVVVMGLSGGGKTTLLRCLAGLQRPTSGSIRIGETEIAGLSEVELNKQRRRMGMVFQYSALFDSLSVFENVVFGLRIHERRPERELREIARDRLAAVGLDGTEDKFPAELSGGMRKRVGLARALAGDPDIVFFDEPTSGLDPVVARVIDNLILHVRDTRGVTCVIVSHDVSSVLRYADRVGLLHEGRLVEYGSPETMRTSTEPVVRQFIDGRAEGPIHITA